MELLTLNLETEKERLQEEKDILEKKVVAIRKAKEVLKRVYGESEGFTGEVQSFREGVGSALRNPHVQRFVDCQSRVKASDANSYRVLNTKPPATSRSGQSPGMYSSSTYSPFSFRRT
jgi:hypothetical protein